MIRESLECPACGLRLNPHAVSVKPFRCPGCGEQLRVTLKFTWPVAAASILITWITADLLGVQGVPLLLAAFLGWIPLWFLIRVAVNLLVPPKIERYQSDLSLHFEQKRKPDVGGGAGRHDH